MNEDNKPECCECCNYEDAELKEYSRNFIYLRGQTMWLCGLCAGSTAGNDYDYNKEWHPITAVICHVGNEILRVLDNRPKQ